jgi:hypothetical protein
MSDEKLQQMRRIAAAEPTQENLARLGLAYLRFTSAASTLKIVGRRWFSKGRGSTFHTVRVYLDGELLGESGIKWGYGNQYIYTGWKLAIENSNLPEPEEEEQRWKWAQRLGITIEDEVMDVPRKRDL